MTSPAGLEIATVPIAGHPTSNPPNYGVGRLERQITNFSFPETIMLLKPSRFIDHFLHQG